MAKSDGPSYPATVAIGVAEYITEPLRQTIDADEFTPRLLAVLSNALVWRESTELRRRYGLGTNEWRVISTIALRPGMTSTDVSEFLPMNKALISKSVSRLTARGLLLLVDGPRGSRSIYLTPEGVNMHDLMLPISMRGQEIILAGMTADDSKALNALLRQMLERLRTSPAAGVDDAPS